MDEKQKPELGLEYLGLDEKGDDVWRLTVIERPKEEPKEKEIRKVE